ncbi:MAG: squalene/phytoene synthase family protein [Alphaproteobacteria bacterium]|nr:MAG: squalene/phytoene synthase family protein [Alphaproteobacteria bacterium]
MTEQSYTADEVRKRDYDRWLATLFAPAPAREGIYALLAFNGEIAGIRETVSEALLGDIRLQWWRDAVTNIAANGTPPAHPVARSLAETARTYRLDPALLQALIDARSADLDPAPFTTFTDLHGYAETTGGLLNQLCQQVAAPETAAEAAARQAGTAYALTGIIRAIPFQRQQDLLQIPADMLTVQQVTADSLFREENRTAFFAITEKLAAAALGAHVAARNAEDRLPKGEVPALRLSRLTELYLKRLKRAGGDPAHPLMNPGRLRKIAALIFR